LFIRYVLDYGPDRCTVEPVSLEFSLEDFGVFNLPMTRLKADVQERAFDVNVAEGPLSVNASL
jgi:hypothetical protein